MTLTLDGQTYDMAFVKQALENQLICERLIGLEFMSPGPFKRAAYAQRFAKMLQMKEGGASVKQIGERFEITPSAVRKALIAGRDAGVIP